VVDAQGQSLAYVYSRETPSDAAIAKVLTEDEARRIASGKVESHTNITNRVYHPAQIAAGLVDARGRARHGFHSLRHFFASMCINSRKAGGMGLSPKAAQERLGHSSIALTLDVYGHLFPQAEAEAEMSAIERGIMGRP
jgi:integrase